MATIGRRRRAPSAGTAPSAVLLKELALAAVRVGMLVVGVGRGGGGGVSGGGHLVRLVPAASAPATCGEVSHAGENGVEVDVLAVVRGQG